MLSNLFDINVIMYTFPIPGYGTDHYNMSYLEFWVTLVNLWSVIAFRKNSIWAYPTSVVAGIGMTVLFYQINLYSEQFINMYYVVISLVGWYWWTRKNNDGNDKYPIRYLPATTSCALVLIMSALVYLLGANIDLIFSTMAAPIAALLGETYIHVPAQLPYWDAFTTVTAGFAMYLLTKRYVESWILWILVNIVSIGLYYYRGVLFLSLEYAVFLVNAAYAWYQWHKHSEGYDAL